jgi:hypothetical protein
MSFFKGLMMSETRSTKPRRATRRSDPRVFGRFLEELSWLMSSYDDLDFEALRRFAVDSASLSRKSSTLVQQSDRSQTTIMLVGVLPSLFVDTRLFPSNEDIVEFGRSTMDIVIPRWEKKSKYELIGHIVCHADRAPVEKLAHLVAAIEGLVDDQSPARKRIQDQRRMGLSWNEVIQDLVRSRD